MSCDLCIHHKKCRTVRIEGRGSNEPKYLIVIDAPDRKDDDTGSLLSGDVGNKVNYFLERVGIKKKDVAITAGLKCRPMTLGEVKKKHVDACRGHFLKEVTRLRPKVIIPMGKIAHWIVGGEEALQEFRGHFGKFELDYQAKVGGVVKDLTYKAPYIPTYSPSASLGKWEYDQYIIHDLQKAKKFVEQGVIDKTVLPEYEVILTKKQLKDFYDHMMSGQVKWSTTDFETTGFNFWKHDIISSGYCTSTGKIYVLPMLQYKKIHTQKWDQRNIKRAVQINKFVKENKFLIKKVLKRVHGNENIKWILHNGKFDSGFARKNGVPYSNFYFDTLLADPLIDENRFHALNLCAEIRGHNFGPYDTKLWAYTNKDEKKKKSYQFVPPYLLEKYLAIDVYACKLIYEDQVIELKREQMWEHFFEIKMPALRAMTEVEYIGVRADRDLILDVDEKLKDKLKQLVEEVQSLTDNAIMNPGSDDQVRDYMMSKGYPFDRLKIKRVKKGYSVAAETLEKLVKYKKYRKLPSLILEYKSLTKLAGTYVAGNVDRKEDELGGMLKHMDVFDRIHANFNLWTPKTSRYSCFTGDTLIETPKGKIPIKDIKNGELVYCYDSKGNLDIKPVLKTFSNGSKKVFRLHWSSSAGRLGHIDLTPDHLIKTNRGFIKANELRNGDKLYFMSRRGNKYSSINSNSTKGYVYEHHFIYQKFYGPIDNSKYDIHHIDENPLNNHPNNLVKWTKEQHRSYHAKIWASKEEHKRRSSKHLEAKWSNDRHSMLEIMSGENHGQYKGWSKYKLLKIILKSGGRIKSTGYDYYTVRKYLDLHNIDYAKLKDRFTHTGQFISSAHIRKAINLNLTISQAKDEFKIGQNKWLRLKEEYSVETNHSFVCLEELDRFENVYDLEVKDHHNYIAGEICSHNCNNPSLQVWPRPVKGLPNIRNFIRTTDETWCLFEADYSQLEQCVVAALSKDKVLIEKIQTGTDLHCFNATELGKILKTIASHVTYEYMMQAVGKGNFGFDITNEEIGILNEKRSQAKSIGFGLNYGKEAISFAEEFGIDIDDAQDMIDAYFQLYRIMKKWRDAMVKQALTEGYVQLLSGRKRRFHYAVDWLNSKHSEDVWSAKMLRESISRQAMNFPVQGGAHEVFEPATLRLLERFKKEGLKARLLLSIHDGILGECPKDELEKVKQCIEEEMPFIFNPNTPLEMKLKIDISEYKSHWYAKESA